MDVETAPTESVQVGLPPPVQQRPPFILYLSGAAYDDALHRLSLWVHHVLMPAYGREVSIQTPWCPRWWAHTEAVAQFYGLWMAWTDLTGPDSALTGPASWHRDYLLPAMETLRAPSGPFAGCKPGGHRDKVAPEAEVFVPGNGADGTGVRRGG